MNKRYQGKSWNLKVGGVNTVDRHLVNEVWREINGWRRGTIALNIKNWKVFFSKTHISSRRRKEREYNIKSRREHKQGPGSHDGRISFIALGKADATQEEFRQIIWPVMPLNKRVIHSSFNFHYPRLTAPCHGMSSLPVACLSSLEPVFGRWSRLWTFH